MTAESDRKPLASGLYFVATPIGNARDITLRALDILADADVLAAEDTRSLRRLMEIHGISLGDRRVIAYHDHNGDRVRPVLLAALSEGKSVAYASEAGTPLVSDPGYALGRAAADAGAKVMTAPGASAALAALTVSGLASDCFVFAGFPPSTAGARTRFLEGFAGVPGTLILFESPKRLRATLEAAAKVFGGTREAAICRELTKKFEEVRRGSLGNLIAELDTMSAKGEVVVCIARGQSEADPAAIDAALREALKTESVKTAAAQVAEAFGVSKRVVYQNALKIQGED